jgi:hypothetical protein
MRAGGLRLLDSRLRCPHACSTTLKIDLTLLRAVQRHATWPPTRVQYRTPIA